MREDSAAPGEPAPSLPVLVSFAAIYLIWGSTYLAVRWAVEAIPPFLMMGSRAVIAGLVLLGWSAARGLPFPGRREWGGALLVGAFLFLGGHGLVAWGETRVPSGPAAILVATIPFWMTLLEVVVEQRKLPGGRSVAGLIVGYAGVALLVLPGAESGAAPPDRIGALSLLLAAVLWAAGSVLSRAVSLPSSTTVSTGAQLLAGGVLLLGAGTAGGEAGRLSLARIEPRHWASLAYLVIFGSLVAFSAYTYLLRNVGAARVSSYAYVNPVIAVLLGAAAGDGSLDLRVLLACLLTAAGVAGLLAARGSRPSSDPEAEAPPAARSVTRPRGGDGSCPPGGSGRRPSGRPGLPVPSGPGARPAPRAGARPAPPCPDARTSRAPGRGGSTR